MWQARGPNLEDQTMKLYLCYPNIGLNSPLSLCMELANLVKAKSLEVGRFYYICPCLKQQLEESSGGNVG